MFIEISNTSDKLFQMEEDEIKTHFAHLNKVNKSFDEHGGGLYCFQKQIWTTYSNTIF